jgi:hypothetical protein
METKYRILYNDQKIVSVTEDQGTVYLGDGAGLMVLVDTKDNAKAMLEAIGINTAKIDNPFANDISVETTAPLVGLDLLDHMDQLTDPLAKYNL